MPTTLIPRTFAALAKLPIAAARPTLDGVRVEVREDGTRTCTMTNGHYLIQAQPLDTVTLDEYPPVAGMEAPMAGPMAVTVPLAAWREGLSKSTRSRMSAPLPILQGVLVQTTEAGVVIGSTDLSTPRVVSTEPVAEPFPRYETAVKPTTKTKARVLLNGTYLRSLLQALDALTGSDRVLLEIGKPDQPILFKVHGTDAQAVAVLMPMRLEESNEALSVTLKPSLQPKAMPRATKGA
jgi:DNA polymerase III sliding clamp (beta) subunit (PCNA family)